MQASIVSVVVLITIGKFSAEAGFIGGFCNDTTPCNILNGYCLKNSACQTGVCKCKTGYATLTGTNAACYAASLKVGASCLDNALCGTNTFCGSTCQCRAGFRTGPDGINCLAGLVALGGACSTLVTPSQCGTNAACTSNICQCTGTFKPGADNFSCRDLTFGESCTTTCDTTVGLQCINGQCQCSNGLDWLDVTIGAVTAKQCIPFEATFNRTYGQGCHVYQAGACGTNANQRICSKGLMCQECPEDTGTCIRKCLINQDKMWCLSNPCQNGGDCVNTASGYTCSCPAGYSGVNCEMAKPRGFIGDTCTLNWAMPCIATNSLCLHNSVCMLGVCICQAGYVSSSANPMVCYPAMKRIGDPCSITEQCGVGAICASGTSTCQCPLNWRTDGAGTGCLEGILPVNGALECTVHSECGSNALCMSMVCTCKGGYLPKADNVGCRNLTYGETCDIDMDTCNTDIGLRCNAGSLTCQCAAGQTWKQVSYGTRPAAFVCVSAQATFTRDHGLECHDLAPFVPHPCGQSLVQRGCLPGLVCMECPENAGSCIRQCISNSALGR